MKTNKVDSILKQLELKPTSQRLAIIEQLLKKEKMHVTAEILRKKLEKNKISISVATIYNNLNELAQKGYIKKVLVNKNVMWFDTNLEEHYHFYDEERNQIIDIDSSEIDFSKLPKAPKGKMTKYIDVVIHIKKLSK